LRGSSSSGSDTAGGILRGCWFSGCFTTDEWFRILFQPLAGKGDQKSLFMSNGDGQNRHLVLNALPLFLPRDEVRHINALLLMAFVTFHHAKIDFLGISVLN
jgi:hypothetical protein